MFPQRLRRRTQSRALVDARLPRQMGAALPSSLKVKLRYSTRLDLQCAAAQAGSAYLWRPFDLYDPDVTSTGYQWYLRDQLGVLYTNYRATKSRVRISLSAYVTNVGDGIFVYIKALPSGTTNAYENEVLRLVNMPGESPFTTILQAGQPCTKKEFLIDNAHMLGITREQFERDNSYLAAVGASPTTTTNFALVYHSYNTNQPYLEGLVEFETEFEFYGQVVAAVS